MIGFLNFGFDSTSFLDTSFYFPTTYLLLQLPFSLTFVFTSFSQLNIYIHLLLNQSDCICLPSPSTHLLSTRRACPSISACRAKLPQNNCNLFCYTFVPASRVIPCTLWHSRTWSRGSSQLPFKVSSQPVDGNIV